MSICECVCPIVVVGVYVCEQMCPILSGCIRLQLWVGASSVSRRVLCGWV